MPTGRTRVGRKERPVEMSAGVSTAVPRESGSPGRPQPHFSIETSVVTGRVNSTERFGAVSSSLTLHGLLTLAVVLVPLLGPEQLPEANGGIRAFLVEPPALSAPPPPPPPPVWFPARLSRRPSSRRPSRSPTRSPKRRAWISEWREGRPAVWREAFPAGSSGGSSAGFQTLRLPCNR